jgi:hypothetical protein
VKSDTSAGADTIITALGSSATATAIVDANIATSFKVESSSRAAHIVCCPISIAPGLYTFRLRPGCVIPSSNALNLYPKVAPWQCYTLKLRPESIPSICAPDVLYRQAAP